MELTNLYLELLKRALNNYLYLGGDIPFPQFEISDFRSDGWTIPESSQPHSLLASVKLNALQLLMFDVVSNNVPGDFLEAGIYKGGTAIFMRAFLKVHNISGKVVWAADSFEGIPQTKKYKHVNDPVDKWADRWSAGYEEVLANFRRYDLLDEQVRFIKGYFSDSLPNAPFQRLSLARLDADSYESTMDALQSVYPKMSHGGYMIIDDWHLPSCRQAVIDFRKSMRISDPVQFIMGARGGSYIQEAFWRVTVAAEHTA